MAEAILKRLGGDRFEVESAGLEPKEINPLVLEVMKEDGYDLSGQQADSVFAFFKEGRLYDYVITVCDKETEDKCPLFPGVRKRMNWPFPDPERLEGSYDEKLEGTRKIRDAIKARIEEWIREVA
jgi:arsenate reductase